MTKEDFAAALDTLGWKRAMTATMFGVTERTIYRWLSGQDKIPRPAVKLAELYLRYKTEEA